jgi:hypothetical protein
MRIHDALPLFFLLAPGFIPVIAHAQFPPIPKEELTMTSDPKAPGAAAVYLERQETEDDPHAFRTIYARIKVLSEAGKSAAVVHVTFPETFVYNAVGNNSSYLASGSATNFSLPTIERTGQDRPWDTDTYIGKVEIGALEGRVVHPDGTVIPLAGKPSEILKVTKGSRGSETTFTMPGVEVGSVIEYRYRFVTTAFLPRPIGSCRSSISSIRNTLSFVPRGSFFPRM